MISSDLDAQLQPEILLCIALYLLQATADGRAVGVIGHGPFEVQPDALAHTQSARQAVAEAFAIKHRKPEAIEYGTLGKIDARIVVVRPEITGLRLDRQREVRSQERALPSGRLADGKAIGGILFHLTIYTREVACGR